jgi:hypothetical protein
MDIDDQKIGDGNRICVKIYPLSLWSYILNRNEKSIKKILLGKLRFET